MHVVEKLRESFSLGWRGSIRALLALFFAVAFVFAVRSQQFGVGNGSEIKLLALVTFILVALMALSGRPSHLPRLGGREISAHWLLALILLLGLILRVTYIVAVPAMPINDAWANDILAWNLAQTGDLGDWKFGQLGGVGYPALLGVLYYLFGHHIIVGKLLNLVFSIATCFLVYKIANRVLGERPSLLAALLYAIFPAEIPYNAMLLSEITFTFFSMLAVYSMLRELQAPDPRQSSLIWIMLAAASFAVAGIFRGVAILFVLATCLVIVLRGGSRIRSLVLAGSLIAVFLLVDHMWTALMFGDRADWRTPVSWTLFVGLNQRSRGWWSQADADWLNQFPYSERPGPIANGVKQRLAVSPGALITLFAEKFHRFWGEEISGMVTAAVKMPDGQPLEPRLAMRLQRISQGFWVFLLGLGILAWWPRPTSNTVSLGILYLSVILGSFIVFHLVVELNPRYKFPMLPVMVILAAAIWAGPHGPPAPSLDE